MTAWEREPDGQGTAVHDPTALRHFSILPEEDADEAFCVRHDREMQVIDPIVHRQGGLYTTTERFSVYTCPHCLHEIALTTADDADGGGVKVYQLALVKSFDKWDQGDAPGDWFRYLGEGTVEDSGEGGTLVAFGDVPGGQSE